MQFLIIMKNKYFMHLIIFEPLTSRGEFLVKELPTPYNYSRGWMEKEQSGAVAPDDAIEGRSVEPCAVWAAPGRCGWKEDVGSTELTSACLVFSCLINCAVE